MRQWVTPRSLLLHLAFLAIAAGCLYAGWWQVQRAMQGNALSYLYSVEWPAFVVVAGIGWWKMFHDTPEDIAARKEHHARMRAASAAVVARTLPRSATAITVGSSDGAPRAVGAGGRGRALPETADGSSTSVPAGRSAAGTPGDILPARSRADASTVGSPYQDPEEEFVAILQEAADADPEPADPMTEYNRYLALLAVKGKAKTWRNPRGI